MEEDHERNGSGEQEEKVGDVEEVSVSEADLELKDEAVVEGNGSKEDAKQDDVSVEESEEVSEPHQHSFGDRVKGRTLKAQLVGGRSNNRRKGVIVRISIEHADQSSDEDYDSEGETKEEEEDVSQEVEAIVEKNEPESMEIAIPPEEPRRSARQRRPVANENPLKARKTEDGSVRIPEDPEELRVLSESLHNNWRFLTFIHFIEQFRGYIGVDPEVSVPVRPPSISPLL